MNAAKQLKEQGLQQGRREEDFVIARKMLAKGTDREYIKDVTGLSEQDLLNLVRG